MKKIQMHAQEKYIAPESEVLVIKIEKAILSEIEPIIDDPEQGM